jgi:hypothetical protein
MKLKHGRLFGERKPRIWRKKEPIPVRAHHVDILYNRHYMGLKDSELPALAHLYGREFAAALLDWSNLAYQRNRRIIITGEVDSLCTAGPGCPYMELCASFGDESGKPLNYGSVRPVQINPNILDAEMGKAFRLKTGKIYTIGEVLSLLTRKQWEHEAYNGVNGSTRNFQRLDEAEKYVRTHWPKKDLF